MFIIALAMVAGADSAALIALGRQPARIPETPRSRSGERSCSEEASEPLARWPPPWLPAMPAPSDEAATSDWMAICDASAGSVPPSRMHTGESDESECEYATAEEEAESVDVDERAHWEQERTWLLRCWGAIAEEAALRQVAWIAKKAAEDAARKEACAADACSWTAAEQAEACKESAAMARAAADVRLRWYSAVAGMLLSVKIALETPAR